jgi:hypothetical protein
MKEIYILIMIPFPQTVWVILSARAAPAADIPNMRCQGALSTGTKIWPYSIMPVDLTACTARTTILR